MASGAGAYIRSAVLLWQRGVWDALQLQRCVVYFVLDDTGEVLAQTTRCVVTNGVVYLGSLLLFKQVTQPAMHYLLQQHATPTYGAASVAALEQVLALLFQLLWLLPVYLISLMVSCTWYQQVAVATFRVQQNPQYIQRREAEANKAAAAGTSAPAATAAHASQQHQQQQAGMHQQKQQLQLPSQPVLQQQQASMQQQSQPAAAAAPAVISSIGTPPAAAAGAGGGGGSSSSGGSGGGGGGGMLRVLEGTAQEVYRGLLFLVFTVEVYVMSLIPYAGVLLNVLFLSWLYAYYCFDYKWALEGIRLPHRLHFFECNWAYFAGFGFPCVAATMFWPFHVGAALANLLFPLFIMAACGAKPLEAREAVLGAAGGREAPTGCLPIFKLALRPTYWLVRRVFDPKGRLAAGRTQAAAGPARRSAGQPWLAGTRS